MHGQFCKRSSSAYHMPKRDLATAFGRCCRFFDHRPAMAYGAALGCVALALAVRAALMLVEPGIVPFALLYPAFMTAALVGGFGPGMAALAIGLLSPVGVAIGVVAANEMPERTLEMLFAALSLYFAAGLAIRALRRPERPSPARSPR